MRPVTHRIAGAVLTAALCGTAAAHWPDQPPHQIARLGELKLERGGVIPDLRISYVTHGKLNAAKDNAVLFLHGDGGNHHLVDHLIGPGRAFDTDKYFIICSDSLGASQTGYEHSTSATSSGLKMKFPQYNERDKVEAQHRLVTQALGIERLLAVGGLSSGASNALQYAVSHPQAMAGVVALSGGTFWGRSGSFAESTMRSIIENCAGWQDGNYDRNPSACATSAYSVLVQDFYTRDWWERHLDTPEAYERWRTALGAFLLDVQDTRDLYYLIRSWSEGWRGDTPGFDGDVKAALRSIKARALFVHSTRDEFIPPQNIADEVALIPGARAVTLDSIAGHTIWYNADPQATVTMSKEIKAFLAELAQRR